MTPALTLYLLACARDREPTAGWALVDGVVTDGEGSTLEAATTTGREVEVTYTRAGQLGPWRTGRVRTVRMATVEDCLGALWGW